LKNFLTTIAFFIALNLFQTRLKSQPLNQDVYSNIAGLTIVDSINLLEIDFGFGFGTGTHGYSINLFSNMTYRLQESDCQLNIELEKGTYSTVGKQLILQSKNKKSVFDIVSFNKCYFFILPSQRTSFVSDLKRFQIEYPRQFPRTGSKISSDDMIVYSLRRKYYSNKPRRNDIPLSKKST